MKLVIKKFLSSKWWSLFDVQFGNMIADSVFSSNDHKQHKKKLALMFASAHLSANVQLGHSCLPLHLLTSKELFQNNYPNLNHEIIKIIGKLSIDDWENLLLSTSAVGNGMQDSPLVLDNQHLYLYRMWKDECIIAQFFNHSHNNEDSFQEKKMIIILNQLFPISSCASINWQKVATTIGLIHPRAIISGGPGTGKTSIIHKIITALLLYNNNLRIKMVAPTGKASTILTNSCKKILYDLNKSNNSQKYTTISPATTLHSLLGSRLYKTNNTYHNSDIDVLDLDYLIIDESSMISLSILSKLISALPKTVKTIFLGDHNQLYSIDPGSVFQDICQFANMNYSPNQRQRIMNLTGYTLPFLNHNKIQYNYVTDGTCILKKNYRFKKNSGIGQLANSIKLGDYNRTLSILTSNIYTNIHYTQIYKEEHYINMLINCTVKYSKYLKVIKQYKTSIINILETFNYYRILCALRHGPFGVIKLNHYIEQILNYRGLITLNNTKNYVGKPIMILRNDSSLGLYNGDIGILLPDRQNYLSAYFLLPQHEIKTIHIHQLPEYETCFVMTIHKAQGSEFQYISIILPNKHTPILTRELFYTSVTRAQQQLFLYSKNDVLIRTINSTTKRYSGLYNKIKKNIQK